MKNLSGKVAVITGAGSGIGRELALQLAESGCRLALVDRDVDGLSATAARLSVPVSQYHVDVTDREQVGRLAGEVVDLYGKVDILINNAGVSLVGRSFEETAPEDFQWVMDVNFWGMVHCSQAFLPLLRQRPEAVLVHLSSMLGLAGMAFQVPYSASKFAMRGFSEALAMELRMAAPQVRVCTVFPGGVRTNILDNARWRLTASAEKEAEARALFAKFHLTEVRQAARTIIRGIRKKKSRILIGPDARSYDLIARLLPGMYSRLFAWGMKRSGLMGLLE